MSMGTLDPQAFVADALALRGALVEDGFVVVPDDVASDLRLPTEFRLGGDGGITCGLGMPLLDGLVAASRARTPVCVVSLDLPAPRAAHATSLAGRFVVRNGLAEVVSTLPGEATYAAAHVAFVAEADDRHEGVVHVVANARDGAVPDAAFRGLLDVIAPTSALAASFHQPGDADAAILQVTRLARRAVVSRVDEIAASVARRHRRDHARIVAYFASMMAETRAPKRRQDAAVIAAKVDHLLRERDAKLRELDSRYALRTSLTPAALLIVRVPAVTVTIRIRRRKAEREIALRIPAGAQSLDELSCEGCGLPTARPAVCDERVHLLCEVCVPNAQGRPDCSACRAGRGAVR